ncbi:Hermansky-Pudlak syndrome 4 protein [Sciurus carolinensis]|uniref:Hermansky-Pudlak syndrome 4 protein n=1 Tax=Sciurus carolinensis TaxID=30640 RepID=A0AA41MD16_SCICA|nr:Hermansky-Pudlak syndrome 4 protein [Sciurus carolinensis]
MLEAEVVLATRRTLLDQQELLCGQIAGVVRCISDLSASPPTLIRLRKLKFAVKVDGDYLWVLGCTVELPDVSCTRFLDQLIGFFHFYNGPVSLAYKSRSQEELSSQWNTFIQQVLSNASDLHKIFNSLWNLDRTKVEPLLLLKAALILQACQRSPHVLAGCILYEGLIVSTQLPPSLTAKVLLHRPAPQDQREVPGEAERTDGSSPLHHGEFLSVDLPPGPLCQSEGGFQEHTGRSSLEGLRRTQLFKYFVWSACNCVTSEDESRTVLKSRRLPAAGPAPQEAGAAFPPHVLITPVFVTEAEAVSLREFPAERVPGSPTLPARLQDASAQHAAKGRGTATPKERAARHSGSATWTATAATESPSPGGAWPSGRQENGHAPGRELEPLGSAGPPSPVQGQGLGFGCSWQEEPGSPPGEPDLSEVRIPGAQEEGASPGPFAVLPERAPGGRGPCCEGAVNGASSVEPTVPEDTANSSRLSPAPPTPAERLAQNGVLEQGADLPATSGHSLAPGADPPPRRTSRPWPSPCSDPGQKERALPCGEQGAARGADGAHWSLEAPGLECGSDAANSQGDRPPADRAHVGLVPMNLYTHRVKGLRLSLLAEESLLGDSAAIEEVYRSSLASLNGLEVHLKETLPGDEAGPASSTYNFTHYDRVQSVLTANLRQAATAQDRRFLQAVSLMHADFARLPALYEMTASPVAGPPGSLPAPVLCPFPRKEAVCLLENNGFLLLLSPPTLLSPPPLTHLGTPAPPPMLLSLERRELALHPVSPLLTNASTAVFACCSPAQETYFQPLAPAARSSGFPSPEDSAFGLPGKARQKLLKHGVNLL